MIECAIQDCRRRAETRGWCPKHYMRWWVHGDPETLKIRPRNATPPACSVEGCGKPQRSRTWCNTHYGRWLRYGNPHTVRRPRLEPGQAGARFRHDEGYVLIYFPSHPNANKCGVVSEHVAVMSDHLDRPLLLEETVHHKNGVRDDNRIENLELWSSAHPRGQRITDLLDWAQRIIARYAPEASDKVVKDTERQE